MQKNSPIAIFDSGVGGLSIYEELKKQLPNENFVYLGDQSNAPYGGKSPSEIRALTLRCLKFLLNPNSKIYNLKSKISHSLKSIPYPLSPKLIVIACNTSTVSGIEYYRKQLPNVPIIGVVPVVKTASVITKNNRIAILSTLATAKSKYQEALIKKFCPDYKVVNLTSTTFSLPTMNYELNTKLLLNIGCPNLVSFIENGITTGEKIEQELTTILKPVIDARCDTLVLGCTHYPFLKKTIQQLLSSKIKNLKSKISILDSSGAVARQTKRILSQNHMLNAQKIEFSSGEFFTTGNPRKFTAVINKLIRLKVKAIKINS